MEDDEVCCVLRWHGLCPVHGMDERAHKHMVEELKQLRAAHLASGEAAEGLAEVLREAIKYIPPAHNDLGDAYEPQVVQDARCILSAYAKAKEGRRG